MVQEVCVQDLAGHCVAFFGHALYSHSAFLHPEEEELSWKPEKMLGKGRE